MVSIFLVHADIAGRLNIEFGIVLLFLSISLTIADLKSDGIKDLVLDSYLVVNQGDRILTDKVVLVR